MQTINTTQTLAIPLENISPLKTFHCFQKFSVNENSNKTMNSICYLSFNFTFKKMDQDRREL